jgi:hypothetical protein
MLPELVLFQTPPRLLSLHDAYTISSRRYQGSEIARSHENGRRRFVMALNVGTDPPDTTAASVCQASVRWMDPQSVTRTESSKIENDWNPSTRPLATTTGKTVKIQTGLGSDCRRCPPCACGLRTTGPPRTDTRCITMYFNGVPRPTAAMAKFVFDKNHTEYIPPASVI